MRYVIIGAGAVGGTIGARLFQSGREVVLVARGAHLAAIREQGLRFVTPEEDLRLPIPAVSGPDELGTLRADDVLVLCVKSQDTAAVLARGVLRSMLINQFKVVMVLVLLGLGSGYGFWHASVAGIKAGGHEQAGPGPALRKSAEPSARTRLSVRTFPSMVCSTRVRP